MPVIGEGDKAQVHRIEHQLNRHKNGDDVVHDDKDEQHHDGPCVDDYLHCRHELGAQKQINQGQRSHDHDKRKRAVDRVALGDKVDRSGHTDSAKDDEEYLVKHLAVPPDGHDKTRDDNIGNGQRQQEFPAKGHQLVVTEARQSSANPDVNEHENENLGREPEYRQQALQQWRTKQGTMPSAEEQQSGNAAYRDHVQVFGHEEHGEFHGAVFSVISGHQFGFCFRQVKGDAVGFRISRHQVNEKGNQLREDVPPGYVPEPGTRLGIHNGAQAEAACQDQNAYQ